MAGLCLTIAAWGVDPIRPTMTTLVLMGICAAGGLIPVRMPGLGPLPASLPIVGLLAVVGGTPQAMTAGFLAGLATAIPASDSSRTGARSPAFITGWAVAGALALAAGLAAAGMSAFGLKLPIQATPSAPAPEQVLQIVSLLAGVTLIAWILSRLTGHPARARGAAKAWLLAAAGATGAALATVTLTLIAADRGDQFLLPWLISAAVVAVAMTPLIRAGERRTAAAQRRASTGLALVESIALAIEAKDRTSERHLRRMRVFAVEMGRRLGMRLDEIEDLEYAALLHDIGKLAVPESILSKPTGLSPEEFQMMSTHSRVGAEILETTGLSARVATIVRHHHERYNGTGYPGGLTGIEIPLGARILAAIDTFEALTSERPYRQGLPIREAIAYLERNTETLFDPRVVRVLIEHHHEFEAMVVAEEKALVAVRDESSAPRARLTGAETRRITPTLQTVLDRIATSHMETYSLHEISQVLGKSLNVEESFALIVGRIRNLIHFSACAVYVVEPETQLLRPRFAIGAGAPQIMGITIPLGQRISGWAALQRRPASGSAPTSVSARDGGRSDLEEIASHPEIAPLASSLVAPLLVDDTLVGVVALYDVAEAEYSREEERLLALIARQVAGSIRTGLLFEQTQELALTDSLTGLPNSRYMFIAFYQESARARLQGTPLTMLLMNIDNFSEINEDFGHHAGDRFLVGMAKAVRLQLRVCDTCIRYAGDEFVALLPGVAGSEVDLVIERITEAARDYCLEARPGRPVRLSLSIGHATAPGDGDDFESLMAAAGARMDRQKAGHRQTGQQRKAHRSQASIDSGRH